MAKYQIIYADPPWNETGGGKIRRGANRHYPLMKTIDICNLSIIPEIRDDNCHLYLWATNNFLPDAFQVIQSWGFIYKTIITWVKDRIGLGQYFRGTTEHCLFAVRGCLPYKVINGKRAQHPTHFYADKLKHSEKPEKMREIIEHVSAMPAYQKIELFARQKTNGWDCWGNEIVNG